MRSPQPMRVTLAAMIKAEPGITGPGLASKLGMTVGAINYPLNTAIKRKEVVRRRVPSERYPNIGQWSYFPK